MRWLLLSLALMIGSVQSQDAPKASPPAKGDAKGDAKAKTDTENKQAVAAQLPPVVNITKAEKLELKGQSEQPQKHKQAFYESPEFWVAAFTGLLVLVTTYLVHYTKKLWVSTKDLVDDTAGTTRLELRPYVGPEILFFTEKEFQSSLVREPPRRLKLCIKNFGKTPAYSVTVFGGITKEPMDATVRPTFGAPIFNGQVIYPDQRCEIELDLSGPSVSYDSTKFWVYGKIDYFDPLSKMDWAFEFCRKYLGKNSFTPDGTYNNETGVSHPS